MSNETPKAELLVRKELQAEYQEVTGLIDQIGKRLMKLTGPYAQLPGALSVYGYEAMRRLEEFSHRFGNVFAVLDQQFTEEGIAEATSRAVKSGNVIAGDFPKK